MSYLPQHKYGNCTCCPAKDVACKKRGKDLICLECCRQQDTHKQIAKSKSRQQLQREKGQLRPLIGSGGNVEMAKGSAELNRWFEDRRKEMTGVCMNCGGKSCRDDDKYYKFSIGHILPKRFFKSVATDNNNWLELCHFGQSCHANLDNNMIDLIDLNCFDQVIQKFAKIYPHIAADEKRRIPAVLIEYLKTEI